MLLLKKFLVLLILWILYCLIAASPHIVVSVWPFLREKLDPDITIASPLIGMAICGILFGWFWPRLSDPDDKNKDE